MEGAIGQSFCLPEHLSISAMASYVSTRGLDIDDPDSVVDFLTQSTFESILTGPDFDLLAQEIGYLPMILNASKSATLESCWSINALAEGSAESVYCNPEVHILDEDYDNDYDVTVEDVGSETVGSASKVHTLVLEEPIQQSSSTDTLCADSDEEYVGEPRTLPRGSVGSLSART